MQNNPDDSWGFCCPPKIVMYPGIAYKLVHRNKKPRIKQLIKACKISKNDFINLKDGWKMNVDLLDKKIEMGRDIVVKKMKR